MAEALLHLGATALLLIISGVVISGLGILIQRKLQIKFKPTKEQIFFAMPIGFSLIGYGIFFLGALQLLYPIALCLFIAIICLLALLGWRTSPLVKRKNRYVNISPIEMIALGGLLLCLLCAFLLALTPETGKDALIYHLAAPKLFLHHHGFYFIPGNVFANYPLHSEMLYTIALFLEGDILAKGLHFMALMCIILGMWQYIERRREENQFPFVSLLIFLSIPSVFIVSHTAYSDLFVSLYGMAAVLSFINWQERNEKGWLFLCGIMTGTAIGSKYTALLLPMMGILGILWASRLRHLDQRAALRNVASYVLLVLLFGCPFYIKNWLVTGNPFYPFLYGIFGGRGWDADQARIYDLFVQQLGTGRNLLDYLMLPWNLSFHAKMDSPQFDGIVGPIFILTLPFVFGMRKIKLSLKIIIVYCVFTFFFWASSAQQIRYLIPISPFLAILAGSVLTFYQKKKAIFAMLILVVAGSLVFNGFHIYRDFIKIRPAGFLSGIESRDAFLGRLLPSYGAFQYVNRRLPEDAKLFLIYMKNWGFLLERSYYSDSMFESYTIQKIISSSSSAQAIYNTLNKRGFTHILYDTNYVFGNLSTFTPEEKKFFADFQNKYLALILTDGPYRLYVLSQPEDLRNEVPRNIKTVFFALAIIVGKETSWEYVFLS
jgi:hypothetical protein